MIEDKDYEVIITIKLSTRVSFAPIERDGPINTFDAIANAVGAMPSEIWDSIETGFGGEYSPEINFSAKELQ